MPNINKYPLSIAENTAIDITQNVASGYLLPVAKAALLKQSPSINYQFSQNYINSTGATQDATGVSVFGTLIYDSIKLNYVNANYNGSNSNVLGTNLNLSTEFNVIPFSVTQTRNIVTTAVNGLNGTVKEFIADGDYIINCRAIVSFDGMDYYDYNFMQNVEKLFQVQDVITIQSSKINRVFGINYVVVKDYRFSQQESGQRNVQEIEFSLISENPTVYSVIF